MEESNSQRTHPRLRQSLQHWVSGALKGRAARQNDIIDPIIDELTASVIQPGGKSKRVQVYLNDDQTYAVAFLPTEKGIHTLNLLFSNDHLPGSPFEFNVTDYMEGGCEKLFAHGGGLCKAEVGREAKFGIIISEAGKGKLEVSIHGPSKVDITYCDMTNGSAEVSYIVCEPGKYKIHIKFDGKHILGSPYEAIATGIGIAAACPKVEAAHRYSDVAEVKVIGNGLKRGKAGRKVSFQIDCTESGSNMIVVGIVGPSGPCEDVLLKETRRGCYEVTYIPEEVGEFDIVIKWGDDDIQGSPFRASIS